MLLFLAVALKGLLDNGGEVLRKEARLVMAAADCLAVFLTGRKMLLDCSANCRPARSTMRPRHF